MLPFRREEGKKGNRFNWIPTVEFHYKYTFVIFMKINFENILRFYFFIWPFQQHLFMKWKMEDEIRLWLRKNSSNKCKWWTFVCKTVTIIYYVFDSSTFSIQQCVQLRFITTIVIIKDKRENRLFERYL